MSDPVVSQTDAHSDSDTDRFGRVMAIVMASLAILAAGLAFLEVDARSRSATASRQARRFATEALGHRSSGEAQAGYGLYSAQAWYELGILAHAAEQSYDAVAVQRYQQVRDRLAELSPFLDDYEADLARYEADVYLMETTALSERSVAAMAQEDAWDAKANAYLTHLALLAVALTLYGLATVFPGRPRWTFVVTASGLVVLILVWAGLVYGRPVIDLPDAAIAQYARGVGLVHQGEVESAIAAFDQALVEAPHYANALYERGNAHYALQDYEAAVADYEAAQIAGRDDVSVAWNLGWTYYLLGLYDEAIEMDRHALVLDPEQLAIRLNLGLALLASGEGEAAEEAYAAAMDLAAQQVAQAQAAGLVLPFSFWYYLDVGARDLESLLYRVDDQSYPWMEAPPRASLARNDALLDLAWDLVVQLKELSVSLEQTGRPVEGEGTALLTAFYFAPPEFAGGGGLAPAEPRTPFEAGLSPNADGQTFFPEGTSRSTRQRDWPLDDEFAVSVYTDTFSYGRRSVGIEFDYEGMQEGQSVLWKFYRNGLEDQSLRWVETWTLGPTGQARKELSFVFGGAGFYQVEMYVEGHLVQHGSFTILPPAEAEPSPAVLFADDFDSPSGNWSIITAENYTTEYVEESYRIHVHEGGLYVRSTLEEDYDDVRIEVDATKSLGTPDAHTFGVLCRFQDAGGWNGYMFLISGDGRYGLGKWQQGNLTWLREMRFSAAIRQGGASANHIRAECDAGKQALYVNGEWLTGAYDEDFASGQVGLVVGAALVEGRGAEAFFDNLVLMGIE